MVNTHHKRVPRDCELLFKWCNINVPYRYFFFNHYRVATACCIAIFYIFYMSDEWLPIVRGNNTMSSYVDFRAFSGKTGNTTSYKNLLTDQFWNTAGGTIYWYKVFVPGLHTMSLVLTVSLSSTGTCKSTGKELKLQKYSHELCVQSLLNDIQTLQSYVVYIVVVFLANSPWSVS